MSDGYDQYTYFLHNDGHSLFKRKAKALTMLCSERTKKPLSLQSHITSPGVSSNLRALYLIPPLSTVLPSSLSPQGPGTSGTHFTCLYLKARTIDAAGKKSSNKLYLSLVRV